MTESTPLDDALWKLKSSNSKNCHFLPAEREALRAYIDGLNLKIAHQRNKATILAHMLLELAPEELEELEDVA